MPPHDAHAQATGKDCQNHRLETVRFRHDAFRALTIFQATIRRYTKPRKSNVQYVYHKRLVCSGTKPKAQQAVPELIRINEQNIFRFLATNALKRIDPEAAAKAGVK